MNIRLFISILLLAISGFIFASSSVQVSNVNAFGHPADDWIAVSSSGMGGYQSKGYYRPMNSRDGCFQMWLLTNDLLVGSGERYACFNSSRPIETAFNTGPPPPEQNFVEMDTASSEDFFGYNFTSTANYFIKGFQGGIIGGHTSLHTNIGLPHLQPLEIRSTSSSNNRKPHRIKAIKVFKDNLYIGLESLDFNNNGSLGAQIWRHDEFTRSDLLGDGGLDRWQKVVSDGQGYSGRTNYGISDFFEFNGRLYAGIRNESSKGRILRSDNNGVNWSMLPDTFGDVGDEVLEGVVYNGKLFIVSGRNLYSTTDGDNWTDISGSVLSSANAVEVSNGVLYVGGGTDIYKTENGTDFSLSGTLSTINNQKIIEITSDTDGRVFTAVGKNPGSYTAFGNAQVFCFWNIGCAEIPDPPTEYGEIIIKLPPKSVYKPDFLHIEDCTYEIIGTSVFHENCQPGPYTITVTEEQFGDPNLVSYNIKIGSLEKGSAAFIPGIDRVNVFNKLINTMSANAYSPPPATNILLLGSGPVFDIKLTFEDLADKNTIDALESSLNPPPAGFDRASLTDVNCGGGGRTHICFTPSVELGVFTNLPNISGSLTVFDIVELDVLGEIRVEGNVLATESIGGFTLPNGSNQQWLAVGGSFLSDLNATEEQKLGGYVRDNAKLEWGDQNDPETVGGSLVYKTIHPNNPNRATEKATVIPETGQNTHRYSNFTFNLNAPGTNPADQTQSSFSSGPEGKIWYNGDGNSTITFEGETNIVGTGTLIIAGDLVVKGRLSCADGTKFGVIASGSIRFESPEPDIACGAYVALGYVNPGNIIFSGNVSTNLTAKGIFIAKGNITLPSVSPGTRYTIKHDSDFILEPPALFSDILSTVFSTRS